MGAPGFWDDQARAAAVSSAHAAASGRLTQYRELADEIGSLAEMADLLREEERAGDPDSDMLGELAEGIARADGVLAGLEEARLFSGEHDAGDAVVQINAGEGGTDAQDWAEMLLRMYLRWAERRGLKADLKEAQEGTEAGPQVGHLHGPRRRTPTGSCRPSAACTAWCGCRRSTRPTAARPPSRPWRSAPLVSDAVEVEILDKDLKIDTYRASGAGGQHVNKTDSAVRITHLPSKIVVQCQNERSQTQNRATAMSLLRARLVQAELERREAEAAKDRGENQSSIGFGSQIRSYVVHPYTMVKDLRTGHETGNAQGVLDGDLDGFIRAELERRARGGGAVAEAARPRGEE